MLVYTDRYLDKCVSLGILTTEKLYKYPLLPLNLACVIKAYAISASLPYAIRTTQLDALPKTPYYLTEVGLEWLFSIFQEHSLPYLRSTFPAMFTKVSEELLQSPKLKGRFKNLYGLTGKPIKDPSKPRAILVCNFLKPPRQFTFLTLAEARVEVLRYSRFYPLETMQLYRLDYENRDRGFMVVKRPDVLVLKPNLSGVVQGFKGVKRL